MSIQKGVRVDANLGNDLDFGHGFYLTNKLDDACRYINARLNYQIIDEHDDVGILAPVQKIGVVIEFDIDTYDLFMGENDYKTKIFPKYTNEFGTLVFDCRTNVGNKMHTYDFIFGVQSDGKIYDTMDRYRNGEYTRKETIEQIKNDGFSFKQLSIHNQDFCDILISSKIIDSKTKKELIDDDANRNK